MWAWDTKTRHTRQVIYTGNYIMGPTNKSVNCQSEEDKAKKIHLNFFN